MGTPDRGGDAPAPAHEGRSVSFQLPCKENVLQSAFEDKPLCVPRQLAKLLQLSVEEVCADFDAMLRHDWRRLGTTSTPMYSASLWHACASKTRRGSLGLRAYRGGPSKGFGFCYRLRTSFWGAESGSSFGRRQVACSLIVG